MEIEKHTPGPWDFNKTSFTILSDGKETNQSYSIGRANDMGFYMKSIAKVESFSDARLIAAAPELLDSLIECLEGVEELNGEYQEGWDLVIEKAKLAINKATGL